MQKLTIYIDMDGVLCNFDKAAQEMKEKLPFETELKPSATYESLDKGFKFDEVLDFSMFEPIPEALDSVQKIIDMGHEVYIATTPPWNHPDAWGQKRDWVEKHLPALKRKMFLTHRKDLLIGDILIDDSIYRGQKDFQGEFMHFGQNGMDWPYVVETIRNMTNMLNVINK
jgi:5'(3')-deoxyribonucleotidase